MVSQKILLNILMEMQRNVQVLFDLSHDSECISNDNLEDRFFFHLHHRKDEKTPNPTNYSDYQIINAFRKLTDSLIQRLNRAKTVFFESGNDQTWDGRKKLREIEISFQTEQMLRLDLMSDLNRRLTDIQKKKSSFLHLAKICSEKAIGDLEKKYCKPKEELRLHCEMLESNLNILNQENAHTEKQLIKCRAKVNDDIRELTEKMETNLQIFKSQRKELETETQEAEIKLKDLTEEFTCVSITYEELALKRHRKLEAQRKMREEMLRREKAATKIQTWFRLQHFCKMRKKKKPKRFKPSTGPKTTNPVSLVQVAESERSKISHKANRKEPTEVKQKLLKPKTTLSSKKDKLVDVKEGIQEKTVQVTCQSSQTDNRVPVTKRNHNFKLKK